MSSLSVFAKLRESVFQTQHPYRSSLQAFPDLAVDRLSDELDLAAKGRERGSSNLPPTASGGLDEVELGVTERIASEHKHAHQKLLDELSVYEERSRQHRRRCRISEIRNAIASVQTDFRTEGLKGATTFMPCAAASRRRSRRRPPSRGAMGSRARLRTKSPAGKVLSIALIAVLLLIETWVNGTFLAAGNEAGLIGGFTQAFSFAALNVLVSFGLGLLWLRYLNRPGGRSEGFGVIGLLVYLAFAVGLNLGLAHFRILRHRAREAGQEALRQLLRTLWACATSTPGPSSGSAWRSSRRLVWTACSSTTPSRVTRASRRDCVRPG